MNFICRNLEKLKISLSHHYNCVLLAIKKYLVETFNIKIALLFIVLLGLIQCVDEKFTFFKVPLNQLILWPIRQSNKKFRICNLISIKCKRNILWSFYISWGESFFLIIGAISALKIYKKDYRIILSLFTPCNISLIRTLCETYNSFGASEAIDKELGFLILKRWTEHIESNGIAWWINKFIFFGICEIKKEWIFEFSFIMGDVFECKCILQSWKIIDFGWGLHLFFLLFIAYTIVSLIFYYFRVFVTYLIIMFSYSYILR